MVVNARVQVCEERSELEISPCSWRDSEVKHVIGATRSGASLEPTRRVSARKCTQNGQLYG